MLEDLAEMQKLIRRENGTIVWLSQAGGSIKSAKPQEAPAPAPSVLDRLEAAVKGIKV